MSSVHLEAALYNLGSASIRVAKRLRHVFIPLLVTVEVAVGMQSPVFAESQHSNSTDTQNSLEEGCQKGLEIGKSFFF